MRKCISLTAFLLVLAMPSHSRADWVSDTPSNCFDPMLIRQQNFMTSWSPLPPTVKLNGDGNSHSSVEINQRFLNDGTIKVGQLFTSNSTELDRDKAAVLTIFMKGRAHNIDFPFWAQQIPTLSGVFFTTPQGIALGILSSVLFTEVGAQKLQIDGMQAFVADGGAVYQLGQVDQKEGNFAFTEIIQYRVSLGRETRHFILASCVYPAAVVARNIKTVTPPTNPKIFQDNGAEWVMKNGSTGLVEKHFKRTSVDDDFYTLQEAGVSPDLAQVLRISRKGGPIQMQIAGAWQTLYSTSEVF